MQGQLQKLRARLNVSEPSITDDLPERAVHSHMATLRSLNQYTVAPLAAELETLPLSELQPPARKELCGHVEAWYNVGDSHALLFCCSFLLRKPLGAGLD